MLNITNYYNQSIGLPADNSYELALLKWTDISTFLRETSKVGILIGIVSSASSLIFNFDPAIPVTCTIISGCTCILLTACARKLEPQAQQMLQHFKELQKERGV